MKMKLISFVLLAMIIGFGSAVDLAIVKILGEGLDPQEGRMNAKLELTNGMGTARLYTAIDGGDKELKPRKLFGRTLRATDNEGIYTIHDVREIRFW